MGVAAVNSFVNPATALKRAGQIWFTSAAIGHWLFVYYVAALYVPLLLARGAPGLADTHLPHGYVPGDAPGNASMVAHLLLAIIIVGGGPLQLIPQIRARFPAFHRWNGRVWMTTAILTAVTGIYMSWSRGDPPIGGVNGQIGTTISGLLVLVFAPITLHYAMKRKIDIHRRWAMRLFMVAGTVWFFRLGYKFWDFAFDRAHLQTFFTYWFHGQYLLPLAGLELYFWAQRSRSSRAKLSVAVVTLMLTLVMSVGIYAATTQMWLPRL